jgi:predicted aspartyl protease
VKQEREIEEAMKEFKEDEMNEELFTLPVFVNKTHCATTLFDDGCESYGMIDSSFAKKLNLPRIPIRKMMGLSTFEAPTDKAITEVAFASLDIGGHHQRRVFLYVVPKLLDYDMILGKPWRRSQDAYVDPERDTLIIRSSGIELKNQATKTPDWNLKEVSAVAYVRLARGKAKGKS